MKATDDKYDILLGMIPIDLICFLEHHLGNDYVSFRQAKKRYMRRAGRKGLEHNLKQKDIIKASGCSRTTIWRMNNERLGIKKKE